MKIDKFSNHLDLLVSFKNGEIRSKFGFFIAIFVFIDRNNNLVLNYDCL